MGTGLILIIFILGFLVAGNFVAHLHYIIFTGIVLLITATLIFLFPKKKLLCSALAIGLLALCVFEYSYPYKSLWTLRQLTHLGGENIKVAINFDFDGKSYVMKRVVRCRSDLIPPTPSSSLFSLGSFYWYKNPSIASFGMKMPTGEAVIALTPKICLDQRDSPMLAVANNAEHPTEIIIYLSEKAYKASASRLKYISAEISASSFPFADSPDEFAFFAAPPRLYYLGEKTKWRSFHLASAQIDISSKPLLPAEKNLKNFLKKKESEIADLGEQMKELNKELRTPQPHEKMIVLQSRKKELSRKQDNARKERDRLTKDFKEASVRSAEAEIAHMMNAADKPFQIENKITHPYLSTLSVYNKIQRDRYNPGTPEKRDVTESDVVPFKLIDGVFQASFENEGALILLHETTATKPEFQFEGMTLNGFEGRTIVAPKTRTIYLPVMLTFETYSIDNRWY